MRRSWVVAAPLGLAAYPVLFLFAHNQGQTYLADVLRPLAVAVAGCAILLGVAAAVYRDVAKAVVVTSAFLVLFFAYGHILNLLPVSRSASIATAAVEAVAFVAVAYAVFRTSKSPEKPAVLIATVTAVLLVFPLSTIAIGQFGRRPSRPVLGAPGAGSTTVSATRRPDIYYIILDSYPSERSLREFYGFENSPLAAGLAERGFYVASDSASNYGATLLSLGSSLNMTHLGAMTEGYRETSDRTVMMDAVRDSAVVRTLRERGYRFVNVASGFSGTDPMPTADVEIRFPKGSLTEFEVLLIRTTPLAELPVVQATSDPFLLRRYAVLHAFEALAEMRPGPEPMFVLAHVLSPHPPFVFDAAGGMREKKGRFNQTKYTKEEYVEGFRGQVAFVNDRILPAIDAIRHGYDASNQPVIIVQGDHGPRSLRRQFNTTGAFYRERFGILNAYYVPADFRCAFYPGISPVNSFRVLFAALHGVPCELQPDESYYSTSGRPYDFKPVSALVRTNALPERDEDPGHDGE